MVSAAHQGRLGRATPDRLVQWAEDAAKDGDFALAALVAEEAAHRGDKLPNDVRAKVEEVLGDMSYDGPEPKLLDQLEETVFEGVQTYNLIATGARVYTMQQLSEMDQETFEAVRKAQKEAGLKQ